MAGERDGISPMLRTLRGQPAWILSASLSSDTCPRMTGATNWSSNCGLNGKRSCKDMPSGEVSQAATSPPTPFSCLRLT
eukprot:2016382-Pyramimonas_sp.AAC.1